jgi:hypothetical protein
MVQRIPNHHGARPITANPCKRDVGKRPRPEADTPEGGGFDQLETKINLEQLNMPTYSAKKIRLSKKNWQCNNCLKWFAKEVEKIRLFGCAFRYDKPYTIYICRECAVVSACEKIKKSLAA